MPIKSALPGLSFARCIDWSTRMRLLLAGALLCVLCGARAWAQPTNTESDPASLGAYACDKRTFKGRELDLEGASITFADEFDVPSVTAASGPGPWFAPVHGGFGGAKFLPPSEDGFPFRLEDGKLVIRMQMRDKVWESGLMQSVDKTGRGFSQRLGYFEMRAAFPKGLASWPAFWLKTVNQFTEVKETRAEVDIIEGYGGNDYRGHHSSVHLWPASMKQPAALVQKRWGKSCYSKVDVDMFDGRFNLYGAEITPDWVIIFFNRKELARFPALPEFRKPMFMLVDLAYLSKEPRDDAGPLDMKVDYVRVWQRPEWTRLAP